MDELLSAENAAMLGTQLFENSPDCMKLLDARGYVLAINPNGLAGMEIDDLASVRGREWTSLFPAESRPAVEAAIAAARRGETGRASVMCPTFKGRLKWWDVAVSPLIGRGGAVETMIAVSHDVTEAHHARRKLERSEARFRSLVTAASAIVWHCVPHGGFEAEQPEWAAFTGQSFDDYSGWGWLDAVHPDDRAGTDAAWRRAVDGAQPYMTEHRLRRADGEYRHMSVRALPIVEAGAVAEWVGVHTDVTEQVMARLALHESRERFQKIVSQAATGVVEMDVDGRITLVNERFCRMLGYDEAELVGNNVLDMTAPDSVEKTLATLHKVIAEGTGQEIDKHYRRKDGTLMSATSSVNALRNAAGECHGLVAIVLDTTASKRDAEALRASEARFRTLFDSMDQAFCLVDLAFDADGRALDWVYLETNSAFGLHTGLEDVIGRKRSELLPHGERWWLDALGAVARDGGDRRVEHVSQALGGRWYDVYLTRVGDDGSRKVAALFRDITERRTAEERLRSFADDLAQADRRKTDFLATLAHELRNPLAPIRSGLGVMRLNRDESPAMARVREMMERQVAHMVHLIDDLLDVARIGGGKLNLRKTRVALSDVLRSAVETSLPLIEAARHQLSVEVPDEEMFIDADATRIAQVVANLLNNAAKYTPAGGRIALSLRRVDGLAVVEVSDTGIGIPPAALAGVFDMFSQVGSEIDRSQGGLGIGLSLVRQLVQMHGGSVAADSAGAGQGSRFTVRLPLAAASAPPAPAPAPLPANDAADPDGLRILVVDDNVDAAVTLAMILEMDGHAAQVAHSGGEALGLVREVQPAVVFLDIGMPGMDGYQTAEAIRKLPGVAQPCLVALTGWGAEHDRMRSASAGFDHHLTKPAELARLQELLARISGEGAGGQARARG